MSKDKHENDNSCCMACGDQTTSFYWITGIRVCHSCYLELKEEEEREVANVSHPVF